MDSDRNAAILAEIFDDSDSEMEIDTEKDESSDDQGDDESSSESEKGHSSQVDPQDVVFIKLYCVTLGHDRITLVRLFIFNISF